MSEFDDRFGVHPHSRPSGLHTKDGEEIRLLGQKVLALDPRTNDLYGLSDYFDHPLLSGRYFYTLPQDVLDKVIAAVGEHSFEYDTFLPRL